MILLEYDFEVVFIPRKQNISVDYFSRDINTTKERIDDSLNKPYIQIASVDTQTNTMDVPTASDWKYDIISYLTDATIPTGITGIQKTSFVRTTLPYIIIKGPYTAEDLTKRLDCV